MRRNGRGGALVVLSASIGGCHAGVADAIAHAWRLLDPQGTVAVVDFLETFAPELNVLARFAYQRSERFFPSLVGTLDDALEHLPEDPVVHELATGTSARLAEYLRASAPDAVVSTFAPAGGVSADVSSELGFLAATVLPEFDARAAWLHPATGLYFVASKDVREELVVRGLAWDRIVVSGIPVRQREPQAGERGNRTADAAADRFTVFFGGPPPSMSELARSVAGLVDIGVRVMVSTVGDNRLTARMAEMAQTRELVRTCPDEQSASSALKAADVVVARAGSTELVGALACGAPLIIYTEMAGHETHNVDFLVACGAALLARDADDVVGKVRYLAGHRDRLAYVAERAASLGRPEAAKLVCERIRASLRE